MLTIESEILNFGPCAARRDDSPERGACCLMSTALSNWWALPIFTTVARCLPVRHTPVSCRDGWTYHESFSPSGSHTILVFFRIKLGASSAGDVRKIAIFNWCFAISRKWYKVGTWNANTYLYAVCWMVPFVTNFTDLTKYPMTRSMAQPLCDSWASCLISLSSALFRCTQAHPRERSHFWDRFQVLLPWVTELVTQ